MSDQLTTRIVFVSDTHNRLDQIRVPEGDLLIHTGDFTMTGTQKEIELFNNHLMMLPHKDKVVIAGNHDWLFETQPLEARRLLTEAIYLQDEGTVINGLKIYGSPWQPEFHNWAFNVPRKSPRLAAIWATIPEDIDILMTHGPAHGILDIVPDGSRVGCELLRKRLEVVRPQVHCFGHIHHSYGMLQKEGITFVNGCNVDERYKPANEPIVLEVMRRF